MHYHTNHSFCTNSNWDGEVFEGEAIVTINNKVFNYSIEQYNFENPIHNPDWDRLVSYESFLDEEQLNKFIERAKLTNEYKDNFEEAINEHKEWLTINDVPTLKPEIITWLNENVKDNKDGEKAWAFGSTKYRSNSTRFVDIFFERQTDALKFIHENSIFKEPINYFDYFNEVASEINLDKLIEIYNSNSKTKISKDTMKINEIKDSRFISDLSIYDYKLIDWERDEDNIDLSKEEVRKLIDEVFNKNNDSYNNLNTLMEIN